jgi:hypothetical protein
VSKLNSRELRELTKARERAWEANGKSAHKARRKVDGQAKQANTRAKYGPAMKPAPVVTKRLTDEA